MAEDKGYWFTTDTGVHVHVEPGETKEQAMKRKFGAGSKTVNARKYEPEYGFDAEREHTRVYEMSSKHTPKAEKAYGYETVYREVKYNGEWGEYNEMLAKYGNTRTDMIKAGYGKDSRLLDDKYWGTENEYNVASQTTRRTYAEPTGTKTPTYTQTFYNEKGTKIGSWNTNQTKVSGKNEKLRNYDLFLNKNNKKK